MEIKGGKIVKATEIELYEYWLKSGGVIFIHIQNIKIK